MKFRRPKSQTITREGHIIFHITEKAEHTFILDLEDDKTTETERKKQTTFKEMKHESLSLC